MVRRKSGAKIVNCLTTYQESLSCGVALIAGGGKACRGEGKGGRDEQNLRWNFWFGESNRFVLFLEEDCSELKNARTLIVFLFKWFE